MAITLQKQNLNILLDTQYPIETSITMDTDIYTIDSFKSKIRDLVRPNRFVVQFKPPTVISDQINIEFLSKMVKKISIPALNINEYVYKRAGKRLHIPTFTEFSDLSITFHNDIDMNARNDILHWNRTTINNWQENFSPIPLQALDGSITFFQLDGSNQPVNAIKFTNCWPKGLPGIEFGHEMDNQVGDFTVDFTYTEQIHYKITAE